MLWLSVISPSCTTGLPFFHRVWSLTPLLGSIPSQGDLFSFISVLKSIKSAPQEGITITALYAWILWNLWTSKNHLIFTNKLFSEEDVVRKSILEATQWQKTQSSQPCHNNSPSEDPRIYDIASKFVCNVDAVWNAAFFNYGMGWILTSIENSYVFTASASCVAVSSALVAETRAIKAALIYAIDLGCYIITGDPTLEL